MSDQIKFIPVCLQNSIQEAFKVQVGESLDVTATTMSGPEAIKAASSLDLVSVMGIQCTGFVGSLSLAFPQATYLGVLEKMLGEKYTEINSENADACSELLNIIYASARKDINEKGFDFQPAIPSTISGRDVSLPLGQFTSFMRFSCVCKQGPFLMAFSLKRTGGE
jgi:CheY-specific phosphatase CheX